MTDQAIDSSARLRATPVVFRGEGPVSTPHASVEQADRAPTQTRRGVVELFEGPGDSVADRVSTRDRLAVSASHGVTHPGSAAHQRPVPSSLPIATI
jgi:hypothetical protein